MRDRFNSSDGDRLELTYNLEHDHGTETVELPFVIGVLAPLAGDAAKVDELARRRWRMIDRDNFDQVLQQIQPELHLEVPSGLDSGEMVRVALRFRSLEDFEPPQLALQAASVQHLAQARQALSRLAEQLPFEEGLLQLAEELIGNEEAATRFLATYQHSESDELLDEFRYRYRTPNREATARTIQALLALVKLGPQADPMGLVSDPVARVQLCEKRAEGQITALLRGILHHAAFQQLEAAWRGLFFLVRHSETGHSLRLKVLPISQTELATDLVDQAIEQSALFRLLKHDDRSGLTPEPVGMLLADYAFELSSTDLQLLERLAALSTRCHCPLISNVAATAFGVNSFQELTDQLTWETRVFEAEPAIDWSRWNQWRSRPEFSRVALTLPRVLARKPWGENYYPCEGMSFEEFHGHPEPAQMPWMGAAWAYAVVLTQAFTRDGWFVRTVGPQSGGRIERLPTYVATGDEVDPSRLWLAECVIADPIETRLGQLGFLPLVQARNGDYAIFQRNSSTFMIDPDSPDLAQARLLARWTYQLGVSRFAQVVRRILQDIGADLDSNAPQICEVFNRWLQEYCRPVDEGGMPGKFPLYAGKVSIQPSESGPAVLLRLCVYWPADDSSQRTIVALPIEI